MVHMCKAATKVHMYTVHMCVLYTLSHMFFIIAGYIPMFTAPLYGWIVLVACHARSRVCRVPCAVYIPRAQSQLASLDTHMGPGCAGGNCNSCDVYIVLSTQVLVLQLCFLGWAAAPSSCSAGASSPRRTRTRTMARAPMTPDRTHVPRWGIRTKTGRSWRAALNY